MKIEDFLRTSDDEAGSVARIMIEGLLMRSLHLRWWSGE
jgi:hypothetical protein